ncbi:unnamed protein product [marine sediment metagenome]|uniref:Uncharacterized protein n=1 Tax=marine sediment metagenome TaxID=412755 RepID=X1NXK3_9ZZZZ
MSKRGQAKDSIVKAARGLWKVFPMIVGTVLLVSLASLIPKSFLFHT